jgi:hypothetical protein
VRFDFPISAIWIILIFKKKRVGFWKNPTLIDISTVSIKMRSRRIFTFEFNWQTPISQVKTNFTAPQ